MLRKATARLPNSRLNFFRSDIVLFSRSRGVEPMNETLTSGLKIFSVVFPDEESCVEEIYRRLSPQACQCKYCNSDLERAPGARSAYCRRCRNETFLTAGTVFHGAWALRPWLAAIWLLEQGITFNSNQFQLELGGVVYSTARNILLKIAQVLESALPEEAEAQPSSVFSALFARRSTETPAREPPIAEELSVNESAPINQEDDTDGLDEKQQMVLATLSTETEKHIDVITNHVGLPLPEVSMAILMLEMDGWIKRVHGDQYKRVKVRPSAPTSFSEETSSAITKTCLDLRMQFHGISRKYLQLYLAWYWCIRSNRWRKGALLSHCLNNANVSAIAIDQYVTPRLVKFVA
jgi:predicted transcriptional regulator